MLKAAFFPGQTEHGPIAVPLFTKADAAFEKTAAARLLPEVVKYIETLRPAPDAQYVLVNAMGAGEFWGSNINGDYFPEAALIHAPDSWKNNPLVDRVTAKNWPYGFPTFYRAHPYAHHRNKDASRAFGEVELATWNDAMKRVELVIRVDEEKCQKFGGTGVWDKLKQGQFPDVSMGCKVPYDTCSICLDWDTYRKAQATFVPGRHKHAGEAVLEYHRRLKAKNGHGIRGLSITRADYCEHAADKMSKILPDGRKVFVYNDYPSFFDISFVFIGADKTAKVMMKIASAHAFWSLPSVDVAEKLGYSDFLGEEKTASAEEPVTEEDLFKLAFLGKGAFAKAGEIDKDTVPSQFVAKAVPVLNKHEPEMGDETLEALATRPLGDSLATLSGLGITLRPREFQRIIIIRMGNRPLADELDRKGIVFPKSEEKHDEPLITGSMHAGLAKMLLHLLEDRSVFGPQIERRAVRVLSRAGERPEHEVKPPSSLSTDLLRKIGAAYGSYRQEHMNKVAEAQDMISSSGLRDRSLGLLAHLPADELFTPMSVAHLKQAFWSELGVPGNGEANTASVERGSPSKNTFNRNVTF